MMGKHKKRGERSGRDFFSFGAETPAEVDDGLLEFEDEGASEGSLFSEPAPLDPVSASPDAPEITPAVPQKNYPCSYLAPDTAVEGTLRTASDIEIAGSFRGEIVADGKVTLHADTACTVAAKKLELIGATLQGEVKVTDDVTLDEGSAIIGNIQADNINSAGAIEGDLIVQNCLTLQAAARVTGDVVVGSLSVARGAQLNGKVQMQKPD